MHFNVAFLNIQCLISRRTNKLQSQELKNIFDKNDLVLLNETWTDVYSDVSFLGFKSFKLSRKKQKKRNTKRNSGGIAIFVRDKYYKPDMLIKSDGDDILWIRFDGSLFNLSADLFLCL